MLKTIDFCIEQNFTEHLPAILSNIDEIKQWATEQTQIDRALILESEEDFDSGKTRCAQINNMIKRIDSRRIEVKKAYNAPYELFEKKIKEVTAILNSARDNLWQQITDAETKKKEEKEQELKNYYISKNCEWRTFAQIFNKKWLNKGSRLEDIKKEIDEIVEKTNADIEALNDLGSNHIAALLQRYKEGYGLGDCISYNSRLKAEEEAIATKANAQPSENKTQEKQAIESPANELFEIDFRVKATKEQFKMLGEFLKNNNITYSSIKNERQ